MFRFRSLLLITSIVCWASSPIRGQAPTVSITEFAVPTAYCNPSEITAGPDGALWFTEYISNKIGRITTAGAVTEYTVPTPNSGPYGITTGPDGALWFAENFSNQIGRITTTGAITEYPAPGGKYPVEITTGPDGNLWFTASGVNNNGSIGQITTAGAVTQYVIPTLDSAPGGIVTGSDGALWFTESNSNKIGRITTAGAITEYTVPTRGSNPFRITPGPDGALWFTEGTGSKIGRITPAGAIAEYVVPTMNSGPTGITTGPDGALWFTEISSSKIGRITVTGAVTEYATPSGGSGPWGIVTGPDNALWFVEDFANNIAQAVLMAPSPGLVFPVPYSKSNCNGGTCTPLTTNIAAEFDHEMLKAYESSDNPKNHCQPLPTPPPTWGQMMDFEGELANVSPSSDSYGACHDLHGYQNPQGTPFLSGYHLQQSTYLYYDGHPGYDYPFPFTAAVQTGVYPAMSGCVTYKQGAAGASAAGYNVLTIIPAATDPGSCTGVTSDTGYTIAYLHLSSFLATNGMVERCASGYVKGSSTCSNIIPCPACAQEGQWVDVSTTTPIAYVGDFANGKWHAVAPHLHFEVDRLVLGDPSCPSSKRACMVPVDPYGWSPITPGQTDPYTTLHPSIVNQRLWQ